jgi:uncharacterized membrane protein
MELIPSWAPNIHPLLVHFPIALLILAFTMNLATFFLPKDWWDEVKNTFLYVLGAVSAIIVFYSGQAAADSIFLPTQAQTVLSSHADMATWTVWFFGIYAMLRVSLHWFKLMNKQAFKIIACAAAIPGVFLLFETAEYGGEMVYGYGAGTGQLLSEEIEEIQSTDSLQITTNSTFNYDSNDNWRWSIGQNGVSELLENFYWVSGSVNALIPSTLETNNNYLLQLNASGEKNTFVSHQNYQNIQLDMYLNLEDLEGEIQIIHHFQDQSNYDFVSINSDGNVTQGRYNQAEKTVFEESSMNQSGMLFLRVVSDGTHFRGYINQEMVVHGHGDAPNAGAVGLLIEGNGTILIDKIELTQL